MIKNFKDEEEEPEFDQIMTQKDLETLLNFQAKAFHKKWFKK